MIAAALPAATCGHLDTPYPLSGDQVARFRADGFIKLADALAPEVIAAHRPAIAAAVADRSEQARSIPMEQRSTYQKAFLQIMNLWREDAAIRRFVFSRRLARLAAELMGCRGVRIYHDQALFKEAGGGATPWHVDQRYWPLADDRTVTAWIPLVPISAEMGPLAFARGSHRMLAERAQLGMAISDESERAIGRTLADCEIDDSPFALGEVSFHYGYTFHRARGNQSLRCREVMTVIYMASDMRVKEPEHQDQRNDLAGWMPGCRPGDLAASPLNPLLWEGR